MEFNNKMRLSRGKEYREVEVGGKSLIRAASASSTFVFASRIRELMLCVKKTYIPMT